MMTFGWENCSGPPPGPCQKAGPSDMGVAKQTEWPQQYRAGELVLPLTWTAREPALVVWAREIKPKLLSLRHRATALSRPTPSSPELLPELLKKLKGPVLQIHSHKFFQQESERQQAIRDSL